MRFAKYLECDSLKISVEIHKRAWLRFTKDLMKISMREMVWIALRDLHWEIFWESTHGHFKQKNLAILSKKISKFVFQIFRKKTKKTQARPRQSSNLSLECHFFRINSSESLGYPAKIIDFLIFLIFFWPRTSMEIFFTVANH